MSLNSSSSGSGSGGGSSGSSSPCGACKFLRRKCVQGCIFAPYFDSEQGTTHFAAVHKVFGASNVSKLLLNVPVHRRPDAVVTICYEAQSRLRDPVYGCVAHIFALQQQVMSLQAELSYLQGHLTTLEAPQQPPPHSPQLAVAQPIFSIADLPSATAVAMPATYDVTSLFDPMGQTSWAMQQRAMDPRQYLGAAPSSTSGDLHLHGVARELSHRHGSPPPPHAPSSNASSSLSLSK
ncbi:LOB domain-containing protein 18-like [Gastrolobium bilobum]|uniref:LOB domain-containing protein 18-like n=1 Tax=Gastrolobium bilobum TaxID=150636 RepID=UPI002AB1BF66|nr:LOB domain-containing protein 18-like [Gastrolobium bilobum]